MKRLMLRAVAVGLIPMAVAVTPWPPHAARIPRGMAGPVTAKIVDTSGRAVGTAELTDETNGPLRMRIRVHDLSPGLHGIHLHAIGICTPAAFTSAGGHFDPHQRHHGLASPLGPHAGDLPNLVVNDAGVGEWNGVLDRVTLATGSTSLLDADGSALVIHATADDQSSDPSGNSGARIACAVISRDRG
jgi:superoxide dismutase, Cu-Zn family